MTSQCLRYLLLVCLLGLSICCTNAYTQTCPVNIDFEMGDFTNWQFSKGTVKVDNGMNTIYWTSTGNTPQAGNTLELILPGDTSLDPIGGFPRHCPNGSGYSIRLGDNKTGAQADGISYTYTIPANISKFSILYNYAVVLESPNHPPEQQPRFRARIIDVASEQEINCVSFDFTASSSLPGFETAGTRLYKNWTPVSVDLSSYAGQTIRLELITSDCTPGGHFGYAYIDVNSECDGSIKGSTLCEGDTNLILTAPFGYQSYQWYSNVSFNQILNTTQSLPLNTGAAPGSVFPVIVTPYPTFGCLDTLYAVISSGAKPTSYAGPDETVCNKQAIQLGSAANANYKYAWSPANLLKNAAIANPFIITPFNATAQLVVKTTDLTNGCFSYDTVVLTPKFVDTSSSYSGSLAYCPGAQIQTLLSVSNGNTQVQWLRENIPLSGAIGSTLQPTNVGNYRAQIKQDGCIDTSRFYNIRYTAQPKADFEIGRPAYCLNKQATFTNKSSIGGNEAINYRWTFDDGSTQTNKNVSKAFAAAGTRTVLLLATSENHCVDSISKTFLITSVCDPLLPSAFTPNGDGRNERLTPFMAGAKNLKRFTIYDRYGSTVFTTTAENLGWDGTNGGNAAPAGAYIWMLEYTDADSQPAIRKGTVVLIR